MCCDLCDHYFLCEDVEHKSAVCCRRCDDQDGCHGKAASGRHMMDYEDDYDDLLDDADDDDDDDDDVDYDFEDDDDDYEEEPGSIH